MVKLLRGAILNEAALIDFDRRFTQTFDDDGVLRISPKG
jgi:hypothetical protein